MEALGTEPGNRTGVRIVRMMKSILVVQTAFLGDVILTLPLIQVLKRFLPSSRVHVVTVPSAADLLENHPCVDRTIVFDKRGKDGGTAGLMRLSRTLRSDRYDMAFLPHRSLRSALLAWLGRIPIRIGFKNSIAKYLYTSVVPSLREVHEIERNLNLLDALGIEWEGKELPNLYPSQDDARRVDKMLFDLEILRTSNLVTIAPGTAWNTKRWLPERFAEVAKELAHERFEVVLVGGSRDVELCRSIAAMSGSSHVYTTAGFLTLLQSAELIRRSRVVICNDSASMHIAVAMRTPVAAIFGATVPEFGFAPYGRHDVVLETHGLPCRPCSKHGGDVCPIKTFVCMGNITSARVFEAVQHILKEVQV